jgi:hypothetical protein
MVKIMLTIPNPAALESVFVSEVFAVTEFAGVDAAAEDDIFSK